MVAAQIPPDIYVLVCLHNRPWEFNRHVEETQNLGCFASIEDANNAARKFMKIKAKEIECTEKVESETTWLPEYCHINLAQAEDIPDKYSTSWERINDNGTISCGTDGDYSEQYYHIEIQKYSIHRGEWNMEGLDLPEVTKNGHQDGCRCSEESDRVAPAATSLDAGFQDAAKADKDEGENRG